MNDLSTDISMREIEDVESAVKYCVQGVEENNRINSGSWEDWKDADHIISVYLDTEYYEGNNKKLIDQLAHSEIVRRALQNQLDFWTEKYMHVEGWSVATAEEWKADFDSMDLESWFGKEPCDCEGLHWLHDNDHLVRVVKNSNGEWVEV